MKKVEFEVNAVMACLGKRKTLMHLLGFDLLSSLLGSSPFCFWLHECKKTSKSFQATKYVSIHIYKTGN